jgi:hypothetical protein
VQERPAYGTLLKRGDGASPETFTTLAGVTNINPPQLTSDALDVTDHSSGGYKKFIQGLKDGGEVSVDINYDPAETTQKASGSGLLADWQAGTVRNWKISFPVSPTVDWTFAAFVKDFKAKANVTDKLQATVTFKVSGQPTLA